MIMIIITITSIHGNVQLDGVSQSLFNGRTVLESLIRTSEVDN